MTWDLKMHAGGDKHQAALHLQGLVVQFLSAVHRGSILKLISWDWLGWTCLRLATQQWQH